MEASLETEVLTTENVFNLSSSELAKDDLPTLDCSDSSSDTCSCVAAGNCKWDPTASGCYIIFCNGHIEQDATNAKADNVSTIDVPCAEG